MIAAIKDVHPRLQQTNKMKRFRTIVNIFHLFTIVAEVSIIDFYGGPGV